MNDKITARKIEGFKPSILNNCVCHNEIKLIKRSYEELQDMVIQLNTDKFILQSKIDKAIDKLEDIKMMAEFDNCKANMILNEVQEILEEDK